MGERISPSDPAFILAGIRQFGLAADGSDLRDLAAAIDRLKATPAPSPMVTEAWNDALQAAAQDCQAEAKAHRSANSGGTGDEPGWLIADALDRAASRIRNIRFGENRWPVCQYCNQRHDTALGTQCPPKPIVGDDRGGSK